MASGIMEGIPGATPGCADYRKQAHNERGMWYCTDHIVVDGEVVHVAGNSKVVCAMWTKQDGVKLDFGSATMDTAPTSWDDALSRWSVAYPPPVVPEEDVIATSVALQKMLQEMEGRT